MTYHHRLPMALRELAILAELPIAASRQKDVGNDEG